MKKDVILSSLRFELQPLKLADKCISQMENTTPLLPNHLYWKVSLYVHRLNLTSVLCQIIARNKILKKEMPVLIFLKKSHFILS
jgi:hypothetical protein